MQFMCLVHFEAGAFDGMSEAEGHALTDATVLHDHDLRRRGHLLVARPLARPDTAATVRVRKGRVKRSDGPFAESKEWIGGFLLLEARDLEEAVALAAESPIAEYADIEVRPIVEQTHSETGLERPGVLGA